MSDNINLAFFREDVLQETITKDANGNNTIQKLGSLQILEKWIGKVFIAQNDELIIQMLKTFKRIRKIRSRLAHRILPDSFDMSLHKRQHKFMIHTYRAIMTLRQIFEQDSACSNISIHKHLANGKIWKY